MGFQGSMIVTREASKDYVVLSTNQSKKLLSGGQMSCNKDAATFWTPSDNVVEGPAGQEEEAQQSERVLGKDMSEWIKEFVQNEFFHESRGSNVDGKKADTADAAVEKDVEKETNDVGVEEGSVIDAQEDEQEERDEDVDSSRLSINDESKSGKVKRNFKVFKFMKKALKRHIKK